jgi:integrase/recombinase XerD
MFDRLFKYPSVIARHTNAPYAEERAKYLRHCHDGGAKRGTLQLYAEELLWIARRLQGTGSRYVTIEQLQGLAERNWRDRERHAGRKLRLRRVRSDFMRVSRGWLTYLGRLSVPPESVPFQGYLTEYCDHARSVRGWSENTVDRVRCCLKYFLRWYQARKKPFPKVCITDIDAYFAHVATLGWKRNSIRSVAGVLRQFFRYAGERQWLLSSLADAIQAPRVYAYEAIPQGPSWSDVQRLLAAPDRCDAGDVRDRAILMLFAIYGLRAGEVAKLRVEHIDWEHDVLHVPRFKQRRTQTYPLLPSMGNALSRYLMQVRRPSVHHEIFQSLRFPYQPTSRYALYYIVASRLKAVGAVAKHWGPHSLRHACATHLLAEGLRFKEIGDHLGHRSNSATRIYAKVDLRGLREVATFDLGELS